MAASLTQDQDPPISKSPPTAPTTGEGVSEGKDSLQGPHDWRKRLKPVSRQSSKEDTGSNVDETAELTGESPVDRVRRASKEERVEDSRIRERLKAMPAWKKDFVTKRTKGPLVARGGPVDHPGSFGSMSPGVNKRRYMHQHVESAFTRQVVNKPTSPSIGRRKNGTGHVASSSRLAIPAWERKPRVQALVAGGRRPPSSSLSPDGSAPTVEAAKRRVEKVLKARLYLLQQNGPNSFLIGGDSPDHKYRVVIGQQRCSCGRGPYCVHVMFVMLRVFQLSENDPALWSKTLKNYEVENLFRNFHARRSSLIQNLSKKKQKVVKEEATEEAPSSTNSDQATGSTDVEEDESEVKDEEDTCPICLLEMVEGESLTECVMGCQNKLHHHCIAVWFEECRRQNEPLICPLCRANWKVNEDGSEAAAVGGELPVPPNTRASSPSHDHSPPEQDLILPHAEPITPEHAETARPWITVLGEDLVSCLFSKNWMVREIAIKQLGRVAIGALLLGVGEGRTGIVLSPDRQATTKQMLECCCHVLAFISADPVYKVFVAALRTLRTVMAYTPCRDQAQQQRLQTLMKPVIDTILWKCADSNKRTSQLSISAMQELIRGQQGELAVGREIVNPGELDLGGFAYLLDCITQEYSEANAQFQWLLGRLYMLHRLLDEHPSEFLIKLPPGGEGDIPRPLEEYEHYDRVMRVLRFTRGSLENSHQKVARMARRVFYQVARLQSHNTAALKQVTDLLDTLALNLQVQLKRSLLAKMTSDVRSAQRCAKQFDSDGDLSQSQANFFPPFSSPHGSDTSSPRTCSPPPGISTGASPHISVTVNNFVAGNLNFVPVAPPNSPERRRRPEGKSTSETETDSPASGATSVIGADIPDCLDDVLLHKPATGRRSRCSSEGQTSTMKIKTTKVDASVCTSPSLSLRGINLNFSGCMDESCTDTDLDVTDLTLTLAEDSHELNGLLDLSSSDVGTSSLVTEASTSDHAGETIHNTTIESLSQTSHQEDSVVGDTSSVSSTDATAASGSSQGMLTEDLSDLTLSSSADFHVSFKTEVASSSPHQTSLRQPPIVMQDVPRSEQCHCKEEVEREEAQALVAAMEQSELTQLPLPFVPGLSRPEGEKTITIRVQDEAERPNGERIILDPNVGRTGGARGDEQYDYLEEVHWKRGPMLGTGAYSTCYQARDCKTGTLLAVKQISFCRNSLSEQEEVMEAVREEIQMMSRLNHPNVVRILGATQQACHFFMFVEWMPGGSVAYLLDRYGSFSQPVIIKYTQQVLRGLAYLHDNQILHRDLKGANLLVDSTGERVRIGDFGASARLASRQTAAGEFQGQLLGTIAFMAPEVLRGESYGRSCDVWSVGCTMIEMANAKPPWGAGDLSNHLALIFKIASSVDPPPIPENLLPPLRDLLLRCLECKREDRPPARELLKHPLFTMLPKS